MTTNKFPFLILLLSLVITFSCSPKEKTMLEETPIPNPKEWSKNAVIYEVNIRQYTPEGTLNAFAKHLPTLDSLGVDILWLMPIYPVGELNRKGSLGSAYAVKDYRAVNPDFGTMKDLKKLVTQAHEFGMFVILDWVANHSAWDNALINEHPDWYSKDSVGNVIAPNPDWSDVADLNYDNQDLRSYMINSLKFWLIEADVDGFRCDVAYMVPTQFWEDTRIALDIIKPVFMLAEAEQPDLMTSAFDMGFGWELHHSMNDIAQGKKEVAALNAYFQKYNSIYKSSYYRMNFTTNHDENSWNGTVRERMGDAAELMAVFSYVVPGMPLIYNGQEAGLDKRLAFFEKDYIEWKDSKWRPLYTKLNQLKKGNKALWNGDNGGKLNSKTTGSAAVYAFERKKDDNLVVALFNMSTTTQQITIESDLGTTNLTNYFSGEKVTLHKGSTLSFEPWEYLILITN